MIPDHLKSTYRQDLADTRTFVTWVVTNGRKYGHKLKNEPVRGKGKARKQAPGTAGYRPTQKVITADILGCAKVLAGRKPPIFVPATIAASARRAIWLREKCHRWFKNCTNTDQDWQASNLKHNYFIRILRNVLNLLEPSFSNKSPQVRKDSPRSSPALTHTTWTSEASLEIPDADTEPDPAWENIDNIGIENTKDAVYELDDPFQEQKLMAAWCFLYDMNDLKSFASNVWVSYCDGGIDMGSAGVITDITMRTMDLRIEEFGKMYPELMSMDELLSLFRGSSTTSSVSQSTDEDQERPVPDELSPFVCYKSFLALKAIYSLPHGQVAELSLMSDENRQLHIEKDEQLRKVFPMVDEGVWVCSSWLIDVIGELEFLILEAAPSHPKFLVFDSFSEEAMNKLRERNGTPPSVGLVFKSQLFLDIRTVYFNCKEKFLRPDLAGALGRIAKVLQQEEAHERCSSIAEALDFWFVGKGLDTVRTAVSPLKRDRELPSLFTMHLGLCGLIIHTLDTEIHQAGIGFANSIPSVMSCAHLYNAARQADGCLQEDWVDMETLIRFQGESSLFIGTRPETIATCRSRALICSGFPATVNAKDIRKIKRRPNQKPRPLACVPLSTAFWDPERHADFFKATGENSASNRVFKRIRVEYKTAHGGREPRCRPTFNNTSPIRYLEAVRAIVKDEAEHLTFDYFAMAKYCHIVLEQIWNETRTWTMPVWMDTVPMHETGASADLAWVLLAKEWEAVSVFHGTGDTKKTATWILPTVSCIIIGFLSNDGMVCTVESRRYWVGRIGSRGRPSIVILGEGDSRPKHQP
ncbi:hypothetical protein BU16DRAFT_619715 [Lophium mytilinum]|uniref:DUF6604 domain-containing protein n=1 Tax=Lophium mytilinum TaxID=390894 RepID=A0A6A6QLY5_9PEZI|nr:hypothetical protein BU16DRAFT_619715 [Lophium mytilinum]